MGNREPSRAHAALRAPIEALRQLTLMTLTALLLAVGWSGYGLLRLLGRAPVHR